MDSSIGSTDTGIGTSASDLELTASGVELPAAGATAATVSVSVSVIETVAVGDSVCTEPADTESGPTARETATGSATTGGESEPTIRDTTRPPNVPAGRAEPDDDTTSEIDPEGSAGPTACANGARNEGFCQEVSRDENPDTGLISGCGCTIRCRGGNFRQSARTTGNEAAARRRKGHTATSPPRIEPGTRT